MQSLCMGSESAGKATTANGGHYGPLSTRTCRCVLHTRLYLRLRKGNMILNSVTGLPDHNPKDIAQLIAARAYAASQGNWEPACGGTEVPFTTRTGRRLLYCWQPA